MPSIRKRIGYLPSVNAQEMIANIANKENLSQSKVVGILVEEALIRRRGLNLQNNNDLTSKNLYYNEKYNDIDELISDKGITYSTKKYRRNSNKNSSDPRENYNEELFEQFKKFIQFQKMEQGK